MPTLAQIREAIVTKMSAVSNVGRVHPFQRYDQNMTSLASLYRFKVGSVDQVRGWYVTRVATQEVSPSVGRKVITHTWRIRGYRSLEDARQSEIEFDSLIEAARDAFRNDETLGGVVSTTVIEQSAGLQLDEQVPVMFAGVLCHMAACTLRTRHYE